MTFRRMRTTLESIKRGAHTRMNGVRVERVRKELAIWQGRRVGGDELPLRYNVIKRKQEASSEQYQENSPNYLPCHLEPRAFPERLKDRINFLTSLCRDKRDKGKDNSDEHT